VYKLNCRHREFKIVYYLIEVMMIDRSEKKRITPENEDFRRLMNEYDSLLTNLDRVIEVGAANIKKLQSETKIDKIEGEITKALNDFHANDNRQNIILGINLKINELNESLKIGEITDSKEVTKIKEKLEEKAGQLEEQCKTLHSRAEELAKIQKERLEIKKDADRLSDELGSIDKPIHELRRLGRLGNVEFYLKKAEDFLERKRNIEREPITIDGKNIIEEIDTGAKNIIEKYKNIKKRFLADEYIEIFMKQSQKLPPTDETSKVLLNQLINRLIDLKENSSDADALNKCLELFVLKLNTDQRFNIPQKIKFNMIMFYKKITEIFGLEQNVTPKIIIQDLKNEHDRLLTNIKNIFCKPLEYFTVKQNILKEIDPIIREVDSFVTTSRELTELAGNKPYVIEWNDIETINEKQTALISLRKMLTIRCLIEKNISAFYEDWQQEQDKNANAILKDLVVKLMSYRAKIDSDNLNSLSEFLESKLDRNNLYSIPRGIREKMLKLRENIGKSDILSINDIQNEVILPKEKDKNFPTTPKDLVTAYKKVSKEEFNKLPLNEKTVSLNLVQEALKQNHKETATQFLILELNKYIEEQNKQTEFFGNLLYSFFRIPNKQVKIDFARDLRDELQGSLANGYKINLNSFIKHKALSDFKLTNIFTFCEGLANNGIVKEKGKRPVEIDPNAFEPSKSSGVIVSNN
jgi:hypothetical protein